MAKVLITGGTGLIGSQLSRKLLDKGYNVAILSRNKSSEADIPTYYWDYHSGEIDPDAFRYCENIIHLAGANIGDKRWTKARKQQILDSRIGSAEFLLESFTDRGIKPKVFISASGIGYYGAVTSERVLVEEEKYHDDFIGRTCDQWEKAADKFQSEGIRTVKLRTGIVLSREGGALAKMMTSFKFRVAAILGNGNQYTPWIHLDDLCKIYIKAIEDIGMSGVFNAVAPEHLTYGELIRQLGSYFKKPILTVKVPKLILRLIFGELSQILLEGSRVSSKKLVSAGYDYRLPSIESALTDLFK